MSLLGLLLGAISQECDDRGRLSGLPALAPFPFVAFPDLIVVLNLAPRGRVSQHLQSVSDDAQLLVTGAGFAERVAERKLDGESARHASTLRPVGHHGYEDGAYACRFDGTCQHGHVSGAVRSGRRDQDSVDLVLKHALGGLRTIALPPLVVVALEAHEGVVQ